MKQVNTFDKVNKNFAELSEQDLLNTEGGFIIHPVLPTHLIIQWVAKKFN